jgi:hypothetical protein
LKGTNEKGTLDEEKSVVSKDVKKRRSSKKKSITVNGK